MPTTNVNGTTLFYDEQGPKDAPTLVLSHSLFFDREMFVHQIEELSKHIRVVTYDHRDQGKSARTELKSVDMDTLTDDAAALIETLDLAPCFFAGNSMGGFIALRLAARRPDLLKGCIVLGSSGELEYKLAEFSPLIDGVEANGTEPFIDTLMYIMFGDDYLADESRSNERERWRDFMTALGPDISRSAHGVIHRKGVLDELKDCKVPLLVLAGEQDHAYEVSLSENIAKAVADSEMFVVSNAGHSVALEQPKIVNEYITNFISAHS
ncbi:alpha/beta hydrolase [Psychrobacter sp. PP-21]|uniref:alpha/beta fold hydrolase n=1 Tax=Psychrobacter sp. PP-21 TaxID=2957503 RepID=UPI0029B25589|nr:alpha/beta fold hydrolase [Psychrobacter sp. PP-21]MDX2372777.1 alpha/beta hydrolase [Psychrobacter sp. PP-21]